ncbi:unnamed protein product [Ectocarpus sp. 8 AP-2014]
MSIRGSFHLRLRCRGKVAPDYSRVCALTCCPLYPLAAGWVKAVLLVGVDLHMLSRQSEPHHNTGSRRREGKL